MPAFLANCAAQTIADQTEIVLVHNEPSQQELEIVRQFRQRHPDLINHIVVPKEPLAVSTNRAIKAALGEYVCIWNVDDLRTADSLEKMTKTLDENSGVGFTYGDFIVVIKWQAALGRQATVPEFNRKAFVQSMYAGPFYMWRKSLCQKIGYWDEQFKSGADFDYAARLALAAEGKKTPGNLGYYLDEGLGLSTGKAPWQEIEAAVIALRFGVYYKLDFWYYNRAKKYNLENVLQSGQWVLLQSLAPHYKEFMESRWQLVYTGLRYPFWLLMRVAHFLANQKNNLWT